jgi:type II secretory pathway pseudopilin PulG
MKMSSSKGFSLAETVIALGVLTTGVIGAAGVLTVGMTNLSSSPADVVMTQKAAQAIESVFSARDSHKLTWSQIRNVVGAGADGGVFIDGPLPLNTPGPDGLVNTADDGPVETVTLPGKDGFLNNPPSHPSTDDVVITLTQYTREIAIRDVPNESGSLRTIVVTITYQSGPAKRVYTLSSLISSYS